MISKAQKTKLKKLRIELKSKATKDGQWRCRLGFHLWLGGEYFYDDLGRNCHEMYCQRCDAVKIDTWYSRGIP